MTSSHPETIIYIDTDRAGGDLAQEIPVVIDYLQTVDADYGSDADGHRGSLLVEYEILDAYIEAEHLKSMTPDLAEWAIENARYIFTHSSKHHC